MPALETDLLNPDPAAQAQKHKLKRLVQSPNSFFMDVKCPGCYTMYVRLLPPSPSCRFLRAVFAPK